MHIFQKIYYGFFRRCCFLSLFFLNHFTTFSFACCWLQRVTLTVSNIGFAVLLTTILVRTLNYHRSFETYGFNIRTIPMFISHWAPLTEKDASIFYICLAISSHMDIFLIPGFTKSFSFSVCNSINFKMATFLQKHNHSVPWYTHKFNF